MVWDGMRPDFISKQHTPTLWQLAQDGVMFANHHPVYPSSTEVNGTAIATGAYPQNSGIIGNREYRPRINALSPVDTQDTASIRKGDDISDVHYLMSPTLAETLQSAGRSTAIAGTKAVAILHDRRERPSGYRLGVVVSEGKVMPSSLQSSLDGSLGKFPAAENTLSKRPNSARDEWTTRALIEKLWAGEVPDYSLLWLSDPDFSQHPTAPGSVKSLAALESCDQKLAQVLAELKRRGIRDQTDVFVVSDHGFSTIERGADVFGKLKKAGFPVVHNFSITNEPQAGQILVNGLGGTVMFYIIGHDSTTLEQLVKFLQKQDFSGVVFSSEKVKGTFSLKDANILSLEAPDVVLSMRWTTNQSRLGVPGMLTVDGSGNPSQGSHTSLSLYDMHNTLVGAGPDLKRGFTDTFPSGNVDLAPTILHLLGVEQKQPMDGRVLSEALTVKAPKVSKPTTRRIEATRKFDESVWTQYLQISRVNDTIYFDQGNGVLEKK